AIHQVRAVRRRELLRIAASELSGLVTAEDVAEALTAVTEATLESALFVATKAVEFETDAALPTRVALVSMGRLGGHEMSFGSDADVMFVHDPLPDAEPEAAGRAAQAVANELRRLLATPGSDPALDVDADLR